METYYVDGKFVPASEAVIPIDDLAIMRGFGVFDLLRTQNGKPLFLKEHILRLNTSARRIGLDLPWPAHAQVSRQTRDWRLRHLGDSGGGSAALASSWWAAGQWPRSASPGVMRPLS